MPSRYFFSSVTNSRRLFRIPIASSKQSFMRDIRQHDYHPHWLVLILSRKYQIGLLLYPLARLIFHFFYLLSVLFKFLPDVADEYKEKFIAELKTLKDLPCVQNGHLLVGGPSVTDPIERSKGYHFALVSHHQNRGALAEYQASKEHHRITSEYLWPFKEDITRFDFEVAPEDEHMCEMFAKIAVNGSSTSA
ncbi:hypothetical protein F5Y18DRAFT_254244 [Xylariaceae sp. FL1019]|nr:hypothetical protein F5Y18DRAFT_254244 [Xylariaceae sp. FL1019]